ncbi:MAG: hypothetical protein KUL88_04895 [Rhizobium sp.]|nr:hypothetical protein [Rhizobium sp.]
MNDEIQDALITARKRLEIFLDLFDDALVASRSYHPAVEACFDNAHFMAHQTLEAIAILQDQFGAPAGMEAVQ